MRNSKTFAMANRPKRSSSKQQVRVLYLLWLFELFLLLVAHNSPNRFCLSFVYPKRYRSVVMDQQQKKRRGHLKCPNQIIKAASDMELQETVNKEDYDTTIMEESQNVLKVNDGRSEDMIDRIFDHYDRTASKNKDLLDEQPIKMRGNIQLVAGSGKTFIAWKVMERLLEQKRSLFLEKENQPCPTIGLFVTPFLTLVDQALSNREEHQIMMGGTDESTAIYETMIVASRTNRDEPCSTDEVEIGNFLADAFLEPSAPTKIIICTYNSLKKVGLAMMQYTGTIDFAVFDEAHKMEGLTKKDKKTNEDILTGYNYGLYDENIDIQNRFFMSGTPHNYTKSPKIVTSLPRTPNSVGQRSFTPIPSENDYTSHKIRSFSDEKLFGPCLALKTHHESVEENITLPISLYGVDTAEFQKFDVSGGCDEIRGESSKDHYLPLAIQAAFHKLPIKHAFSFHSTNVRARQFAHYAERITDQEDGLVFRRYDAESENSDSCLNNTDYANENEISVFNLHHSMSMSTREAVLQSARRAPKSLITNCKLLLMGIDVPSLDMVVIADPVRSAVDGRQMIGRVGRKSPGKERGYVLVPLPVEIDEKDQCYQIFVNTFQHMVSVDPALRQDMLVVIEKSENLTKPLTRKDFPERFNSSIVFPPTIPLEFQNELMNRVVAEFKNSGINADRWNTMFKLLNEYYEREGDCNVPQTFKVNGENLGNWLDKQRQKQRNGVLDEDYETKLTNLGVVWDPNGQRWDEMYSLMLEYKEREGNCNIPTAHIEDGRPLGKWLSKMRVKKNNGDLDKILDQRLTDLGVAWVPFDQLWEDKYALLVQYEEREGNCNVPYEHKEDGQTLGYWLTMQKAMKKNGRLRKDREVRLTDLGVVWERSVQQWEDKYSLLVRYREREGDCNVMRSHREDGENLGTWLDKQRQKKRSGKLLVEQESRLTSLGVIWERRKSR